MAKSPDAFRTISEVADWLGIQAHVLRFWESKFTQVKPIKRAGGRRYYRPNDMLLLGGIKKLLHDDGLTIKGVQKILREEGMSHVAALSQPLDEELETQAPAAKAVEKPAPVAEPETVEPEEEKGVVLSFGNRGSASEEETPEPVETAPEDPSAPEVSAEPEAPAEPEEPTAAAPASSEPEATEPAPAEDEPAPEAVEDSAKAAPEEPTAPDVAADEPEEEPAEAPEPVSALPAFLRRPLADPEPAAETDAEAEPQADASASEPASPEPQQAKPEPEPAPPPAPKPRIVDLPPFVAEADFPASPAALSAAYRARSFTKEQAAEATPLLAQLTALRDAMAARRRNPPTSPAKD